MNPGTPSTVAQAGYHYGPSDSIDYPDQNGPEAARSWDTNMISSGCPLPGNPHNLQWLLNLWTSMQTLAAAGPQTWPWLPAAFGPGCHHVP